jgi:hypothetical protein
MTTRYYTNGLRFDDLQDAIIESKKHKTPIYKVVSFVGKDNHDQETN